MIFTRTTIDGAWLITLEPRSDHRGSFGRAYCRREFEAHGIRFDVVQANLAQTHRAGVVRGLHYQPAPQDEQKLVRCVTGAVLDVIIDMRPGSPTFRAVFQTRLDRRERLALFVPAGVAHGYQALEDDTEFLYLTDFYYVPGLEKGVRFSDPALGVSWPLPPRDVTERDASWPLLS
ncbi:MAG: dTDP-4-dehydrorhamnose 3,5-epimerase family protein [Rubrivivax sp.]|nr:dTDP-4-dehydrorhamnose 3,5-epimerase family protein [Rubrivivax sp.]